jgi:hypothetical protein
MAGAVTSCRHGTDDHLIIGLELNDLSVDGCMTKAPRGGDKAGPSPVDRRKGGLKRSTATDGYGIPLAIASAGAHRRYIKPSPETIAEIISLLAPGDSKR